MKTPQYRIEPVRINVGSVIDDLGLTDLYFSDSDELNHRIEAADEALFDAYATPEEAARVEQLRGLSTNTVQGEFEQQEAFIQEARAIREAIRQRAEATGGPFVAAKVSAEKDEERVREMWERDQAEYLAAYKQAIRQALTDRGITIEPLFIEATFIEPTSLWDPLVDALHDLARTTALLPMTGAAPDWTTGTPADALRRANPTYIDRLHHAL